MKKNHVSRRKAAGSIIARAAFVAATICARMPSADAAKVCVQVGWTCSGSSSTGYKCWCYFGNIRFFSGMGGSYISKDICNLECPSYCGD